jgi:rubrerythrin
MATTFTSGFLAAAERMESVAQRMYEDLAIAYAGQPELHQLFRRLAAEEAQHAMRIQLLQRHKGGSAWPREALERFGREVDLVIAEMAAIRRGIGTTFTPDDATPLLRRLAAMEDRFRSVHAQDLARHAGPEAERLFATLALQDSAHLVLLQAAAGRPD